MVFCLQPIDPVKGLEYLRVSVKDYLIALVEEWKKTFTLSHKLRKPWKEAIRSYVNLSPPDRVWWFLHKERTRCSLQKRFPPELLHVVGLKKNKTHYVEEWSPINLQRCVGTNLLLQVNKTIDYRGRNVAEIRRPLQPGRQTGARGVWLDTISGPATGGKTGRTSSISI